MADHGGNRTGAGRPSAQERFAGKVTEAERKIADKLPDLIDAMLVLALGHVAQKIDRNGEVEVYDVPPNFKAIEYLSNRVMGKPADQKQPEDPEAERPKILGYVVQMPQTAPPPTSPPSPTAPPS